MISRRNAGLLIVVSLLSIILAVPRLAVTQEVFVQSGPQEGHGVLRARGVECFVLLPKHILKGTTGSAAVIGRNDTRANAVRLRSFENDLSILRLTDGDYLGCDPWMPLNNFDAMLRTQTAGVLYLAQQDGKRTYLNVDITSIDKDYIYVKPTTAGTEIRQTMSGGALYINGALAGLMQNVDRALRLDIIMADTDEYFTAGQPEHPAQPELDLIGVTAATEILDRATAARDGSSQGQQQAVTDLIAQHFEFLAVDWSGLSFKGADLSGGVFSDSRMHMIDLTGANARRADFKGCGLRFANLEGVRMQDANLSDSYAPFISAAGSNFDGANLSRANFLGGDFRGASFRNATLTGTSFAFADLRGAVFDDADLTDAHLAGAIFDDTTSFVHAIIENTDFQGAAAASLELSRGQKVAACRGPVHLGEHYTGLLWDIKLMEQWEDKSSSTGLQFDDIYTKSGAFASFKDNSLPLCKTPEKTAVAVYLDQPAQTQINLDRSYLLKHGRSQAAVERVNGQLAVLEKHLRPKNLLKGSGKQVQSWAAHINRAVKQTQLVSKPYMNPDHFLVLSLARGILDLKKFDERNYFWRQAAEWRFRFESVVTAQGGNFSDYDGWTQFFPPMAAWVDLPDNTAELYRQWVLDRRENVPDRLVTHRPLIPCDNCPLPQPGEYGIEWVFPSIPVGADYVPMDSWSASEQRLIREYDVPPQRVRQVRTVFGTALLVMPHELSSYRLTIPEGLDLPEDGWFELDLEIRDIRGHKDDLGNNNEVLIFLEPGEVRLHTIDQVLWKTKLKIVETKLQDK